MYPDLTEWKGCYIYISQGMLSNQQSEITHFCFFSHIYTHQCRPAVFAKLYVGKGNHSFDCYIVAHAHLPVYTCHNYVERILCVASLAVFGVCECS